MGLLPLYHRPIDGDFSRIVCMLSTVCSRPIFVYNMNCLGGGSYFLLSFLIYANCLFIFVFHTHCSLLKIRLQVANCMSKVLHCSRLYNRKRVPECIV